MKFTKKSGIIGGWAKASELANGTECKLVSAADEQPSQFKDKNGNDKTQIVAKIRFEGKPDALNIALNNTTINGLIDAFGESSEDWQGHTLTVDTEKVRVGGVAKLALYLIPPGYRRTDDVNGYAVIVKEGGVEIPVVNVDEDKPVKEEDLPF